MRTRTLMGTTLFITAALAGWVWPNAVAEEIDYSGRLRYPKGLVPGIGLNQVEQEGGPAAVGYKRRTVQWWPRRGQDIVDIPEGAPLRTWTRNNDVVQIKYHLRTQGYRASRRSTGEPAARLSFALVTLGRHLDGKLRTRCHSDTGFSCWAGS